MGVVLLMAGWIALFCYGVVHDRNVKLVPLPTLAAELRRLAVPEGARASGDMRITYKTTIFSVSQDYTMIGISDPSLVAHYKQQFAANGWMYAGADDRGGTSYQFCKHRCTAVSTCPTKTSAAATQST